MGDFDDAWKSFQFSGVLGPLAHIWYARQASIIQGYRRHAERILDLGTGPGHLLASLSRRYPDAFLLGLDLSGAMLDLARMQPEPGRYNWVRGSFYSLPFRDQSFDLVTATGLLHHADALQTLLGEVRRVLIPRGCFVGVAFRRDVPRAVSVLARLHSGWKSLTHSQLEGLFWVLQASWTKRELEDAFAKAGFRHAGVQAGILMLRMCAKG